MSFGGNVTSSPTATHCLWTSSTSSTHTDIHTPLSAVSSPSGPNVELFAPLPRLPWPPRQRNISHSPDPTAPKVGGVPQSQHFFQPHFSNHAKLAGTSDTFKIGTMCFASMARKHTTPLLYSFRRFTAKTHRSPLLTPHSSPGGAFDFGGRMADSKCGETLRVTYDQPGCRPKTIPSVLAVHQPATLLPISSSTAVLASDPVLSTSASASSDPHASPAPRLTLLT